MQLCWRYPKPFRILTSHLHGWKKLWASALKAGINSKWSTLERYTNPNATNPILASITYLVGKPRGRTANHSDTKLTVLWSWPAKLIFTFSHWWGADSKGDFSAFSRAFCDVVTRVLFVVSSWNMRKVWEPDVHIDATFAHKGTLR